MDDLRSLKITTAVLATAFVIFGLQNLISIVFEKSPPAKPGYFIAVAQTAGGGGPAADVIPDWGTVLPKADIAAGQAITAKCASCHKFDSAGTNSIGPGLFGVVGRPPGTHPGYSYDAAMQGFAKTHKAWTYDLLYQFLKGPQNFMPGTKMTFIGLPAPQDRINVIAYLRSNGSPNYPIPPPKPAAKGTAKAAPAPSTPGKAPTGQVAPAEAPTVVGSAAPNRKLVPGTKSPTQATSVGGETGSPGGPAP
ncbi:MAG TPA: c-type cytochrome [Caulobacteraceae bacterium]|nr:c-type cytochrome [Caulobacteraceae bacterium]